jgi:hypothetical protein
LRNSKSLELQQRFLKSFLHSKPSKFKELSVLLKEYSKREIKLKTVYEKLKGNMMVIA